MSAYPGWLQKFLTKMAQQQGLKKEALDKLPEDELNGVIPGMNADPAAMGQPMPMDPSMMGMAPAPEPEPEPDVSGNVFEVDVNGIKVKLKLVPEFVMTDGSSDVLPQPPAEPAAPMDAMADTSLNPGADPMALAQWMEDPNNEKAYGNQEQGTVEPLSQEDQGIPVHDTGSEAELAQQQQQDPKVQVHKKPKKQAAAQTPGADRSTPYYPCAVCANFDVQNNKCSQGLDVEKVQAAKSCSWLNSNFQPFGGDGQMENSGQKDGETYNSDINKAQPGAGEGQRAASKNLKNIWRK